MLSLLYGLTLHIWTIMSIHLYMTTGKTIPLITQNFVGKVMSLLLLRLNHRKRRQQRQLIEVVRMRGGKVELSSVTETTERATQEGGGSS